MAAMLRQLCLELAASWWGMAAPCQLWCSHTSPAVSAGSEPLSRQAALGHLQTEKLKCVTAQSGLLVSSQGGPLFMRGLCGTCWPPLPMFFHFQGQLKMPIPFVDVWAMAQSMSSQQLPWRAHQLDSPSASLPNVGGPRAASGSQQRPGASLECCISLSFLLQGSPLSAGKEGLPQPTHASEISSDSKKGYAWINVYWVRYHWTSCLFCHLNY